MGYYTVIYITAVLVSLVFERQERRHRFELDLEYERLGKVLPPLKPRLSIGTSWLNVVVGAVMLLLGIPMLWSQIQMLKIVPLLKKSHDFMSGMQFEISGVWLATAIALIILGLKSVQQRRGLAKEGPKE